MCGFKCETTDTEVYFTQFLCNLCACVLTARIYIYKCMIALMIATLYLGKVFVTDTSMRGRNMLREKCRQLWVIFQQTFCFGSVTESTALCNGMLLVYFKQNNEI